MSITTLNLPIEKGVACFLIATHEEKEQDVSPLVKSFSIDNVNVPADFDDKRELANAHNEKYL